MFTYQVLVAYLQNQVRGKRRLPLAYLHFCIVKAASLYLLFAMKLNPNQHFKWSKRFITEQLCCLPGNHPPSDVHGSSGEHCQRDRELCFNLQPPVGCHVSVSCLFFLLLAPSVYSTHMPLEEIWGAQDVCVNAGLAAMFVISSGWVGEPGPTGRREEMGGQIGMQLDKYSGFNSDKVGGSLQKADVEGPVSLQRVGDCQQPLWDCHLSPFIRLHQMEEAPWQNMGRWLTHMSEFSNPGEPNLTLVVWNPSGWSTECLQEWGSHMKLALPSMLMLCFEWWYWEVGGFLAGQCGFLSP